MSGSAAPLPDPPDDGDESLAPASFSTLERRLLDGFHQGDLGLDGGRLDGRVVNLQVFIRHGLGLRQGAMRVGVRHLMHLQGHQLIGEAIGLPATERIPPDESLGCSP